MTCGVKKTEILKQKKCKKVSKKMVQFSDPEPLSCNPKRSLIEGTFRTRKVGDTFFRPKYRTKLDPVQSPSVVFLARTPPLSQKPPPTPYEPDFDFISGGFSRPLFGEFIVFFLGFVIRFLHENASEIASGCTRFGWISS